MKVAVIIYHKNVNKIYLSQWIKRCVDSIKQQTYKDFDVFECDYGNQGNQIYQNSNHENKDFKTHTEAHNFLLDKVFSLDYDCAMNINCDDFYDITRFEKQIEAIKEGYDVVSSNFYRVNRREKIYDILRMSNRNIRSEADRGHNIIAHPVVCYSKNFWLNCTRLNPEEIPKDDFMLWKRSFEQFKFIILPDYLLYQRIHNNNVSR